MSVLEQLEAAILSDPLDLDAYAVYGDYLVEQGDPRGELIAVQIAAERSADPELGRAALRVFAKHRDYLIGELGSMIATDAFTWRAGFIQRAVLSQDRMLIEDGARVASSLAEVVTKLFSHPSARFLRELVIRTNDRSVQGSQKDIVDAIARARPQVLRRLQLGDATYGFARIGRLEQLWPSVASLDELVVEGDVSFGKLELPELRTLSLWAMPLKRKLARELVEAKWPKLRSLSLNLGNSPEHITREIVMLMHRTDMPGLRHLGLLAFQDAEKVIEELSRAPLLARLESLELRHGKISDRGVKPMLVHAAAFEHLRFIDLRGTAITVKQLARLVHRLPNVVGKSP